MPASDLLGFSFVSFFVDGVPVSDQQMLTGWGLFIEVREAGSFLGDDLRGNPSLPLDW